MENTTSPRLSFLDRLPHAVDLRRYGRGRRTRVPGSRRRALPRPLQRRHDFHPHRHRADPDDVSAAGEGEVRRNGACLPAPPHPAPLARPELGGRTDPDVRARRDLPARQARVHDRPDPDRSGPLHRHGDRLERPRARRPRVRGRPGRLQLDLPGAVLLGLFVLLPRHRPPLAGAQGGGGGHLHGRNREERLHLPRHSVHRRHAHPLRDAEGQGPPVVREDDSSRRSARSR